MRKKVILSAIMLVVTLTVMADVRINETTFPDSNFRNWVLAQDYGADGALTSEELENITSLDVRRLEIHDLKGIEYFVALKDLNCMTNKLTALDLSKNTALEKLECIGNRLTTINLRENKKLKFLSCGSNQLTALDVSGCTELDTLSCSSNQLTALNVSKNTKLTCLECLGNQLTALDLSKNTALGRLHCNANQLTALDVSKNTALHLLQCSSNLITTLDVTKNSALKDLSCNKNKLTTLYVINNKSLEWIICSDNQLTSLDVSGCSALKSLGCSDNQLSALNLSGCPTLIELHCDGNQLTTLDLSDNSALISLYCKRNKIMGTGMDALVESLPIVSEGSLYVMNFEKEQNMMTTTQVSAAKAKGWTPYILTYSIKMEYAGSETTQDNYRPFVEEGKVWKVAAGMSNNQVKIVRYYYFDGDTIIDGKTCKQMMCQKFVSPDYPDYALITQYPLLNTVGAWYEEDKKVYIYNSTSKQFKMMYDFSLDANDILHFLDKDGYPPLMIGPNQTGGLEGFKGVYRDIMMYVDERTIHSTFWLEGVGSIDGPTANTYYYEKGIHETFLMSCTIGDEIIYLNDEYEDGATPESMGARKNRFDFTHTIKTKPKARKRSEEEPLLYGEYNDLKLDINLNPLDDAYQVRITDESGKVVYEKAINAGNIVGLNIDISAYAKGRYTVTVENSEESFTGEFYAQTTGIVEVINKTKEVKSNIYNLQGQRLNSLQKGLNIVNGQKIFVK